MLARGRGNAVFRIYQIGGPACRDTVLYACLHDQRHDGRIEPLRGLYFADILQATGEPEWYVPHLRTALLFDDADTSLYQVFDLAIALIRRGIEAERLRPAIHSAFTRYAIFGEDIGGESLIQLEGREGFTRVARTFTAHPLSDEEADAMFLLDTLIGQEDDADGVRHFTEELAACEPELALWLTQAWSEWEAWQGRLAAGPQSPPRLADYDAIRANIMAPGSAARRWSQRLSEADFRCLAEDFLSETDPERQKKYLYQFRWRTFPLDPAPLTAMARGNPEDMLTRRALSALDRITHAKVRALADEFLAAPGSTWLGLGLLVKNPGPDDLNKIEEIVSHPERLTEQQYHTAGIAVRKYTEAHPTPEAASSLLQLYERGVCSTCRYDLVKMLIAEKALPDEIREECRFDAYPDTRGLVNAG